MINTLFLTTVSVEPTLICCFPLALANIRPRLPVPFNFFEEQCIQNHPQYLSALSRALLSTTFLEIAVYGYIYGLARMLMSKNVNNDVTMNPPIECFHSRGQHLCKYIGTKESVCIRKEFNSQKIGLGHQHGRRFIVLGHQYGRRDVM